jgi:hypothetical protein
MFFLAFVCSSWFLGIIGAEVDDAQDSSWRRCFVAWLYLAAKSSYVGVDVDGLAYPLHHPMACNRQTREHGLSTRRCLVPSLQWAMLPFRGCEAPRVWIFGEELTTWVPVLLSFTWSILFLLGYVYLMSEPS